MKTVTVSEFAEKNKISMISEWVDSRPDDLMSNNRMNHYKCTLKNGSNNGRKFTLYFSIGMMHTKAPKVEDVLNSLACDITCELNDFERFCSDLGYDSDSRKAEKIFKAIQHEAKRLAEFLTKDQYVQLCELERL